MARCQQCNQDFTLAAASESAAKYLGRNAISHGSGTGIQLRFERFLSLNLALGY